MRVRTGSADIGPPASRRPARDWARLRQAALGLAFAVLSCGIARAQLPVQIGNNTFPPTVLGQSGTRSVKLSASPLLTAGITITGVQADPATPEYAVLDASGCVGTGALAPGASCSVTVQFTPASPGQAGAPVPLSHGGTLVVNYFSLASVLNAGSVEYLELSGTGAGPHGVFTPGIVSRFAGNDSAPILGYSGDGGPAAAAGFNHPSAIAVDAQGNVYIADTQDLVVRMIYNQGLQAASLIRMENPSATVTGGDIYTIAGNGNYGAGTDGVAATQTAMIYPGGVAVDLAGNVYIADSFDNAVRVIYMGDLPGAGLATVLAAHSGSSPVRGFIYTVAGQLDEPNVDPNGNYCNDYGGSPSSAGLGNCWNGDGGPASKAQLYQPEGLAVDSQGDVLIADAGNDAVRAVFMGGQPGFQSTVQKYAEFLGYGKPALGDIYTLAGNPTLKPVTGYGDGGLASGSTLGLNSTATVNDPVSVAVDSAGDLYIVDFTDELLRTVSAGSGDITTASSPGTTIASVAIDAGDNAIFALQGAQLDNIARTARPVRGDHPETGPHRGTGPNATTAPSCSVWNYQVATRATRVLAGDNACEPSAGKTGDGGAATQAELNYPAGVAADGNGNLYILEAGAVRAVDVSRSMMAFGSHAVFTASPPLSVELTDLDIYNPVSLQPLDVGQGPLAPLGSEWLPVPAPFVAAPYFNPSEDCGSKMLDLVSDESCWLSAEFQPVADGAFQAVATYFDSSFVPGSSVDEQPISLTGTGTGAAPACLTISPSSLSFAAATGVSAPSEPATLTNSCPVAVNFQATTGTGIPFSLLSSACGSSVPANSTCSLKIGFLAPAIPGPASTTFTGQLTVTSPSAGSPLAVSLTGVDLSNIVIPVAENITLVDGSPGPSVMPAVLLKVTETVHLNDSGPKTSVLPALLVNIAELIHVNDNGPASTVIPAALIGVSETIHLIDSSPAPSILPAVLIKVAESIHVNDSGPALHVIPAALIGVSETIHLIDNGRGTAIVPATLVAVAETIHLIDGAPAPQLKKATPIAVSETIRLDDTGPGPGVLPAALVEVAEVIHLIDGSPAPAVKKATPIAVAETIHLDDTGPGTGILPTILIGISEAIHLADSGPGTGILPAVLIRTTETIHLADGGPATRIQPAALVHIAENIHMNDTGPGTTAKPSIFLRIAEALHLIDTPKAAKRTN